MTRKGAYYNENDPGAAEWLRTLMLFGHIAEGDVDERSIEDVCADDLRGYVQCHFFAGIGVWSAALREAGWPDDREVWTGSCPCQPFSAAGQGAGFADERHLWPAWFFLIEQHRPGFIFGEQVASKPGLAWFDLVHADLEGAGYACGAHDLCAASVGAPHIRQRLYFVADANGGDAGAERQQRGGEYGQQPENSRACARTLVDPAGQQAGLPRRAREPGGSAGQVGYSAGPRPLPGPHGGLRDGEESLGPRDAKPERRGAAGLLGVAAGLGQQDFRPDAEHVVARAPGRARLLVRPADEDPWSPVEWIACRDGKWRPTQPGLLPLAHGASARVGRLRGYGNAIVLPVAQAFIEAAMTCL